MTALHLDCSSITRTKLEVPLSYSYSFSLDGLHAVSFVMMLQYYRITFSASEQENDVNGHISGDALFSLI